MPKKNLLITCAGGSGPIYLARKLKVKYNIFLVDATDQNMGAKLGFPFQVVPFGNHPSYHGLIMSLIRKWKIDIVVPGAEEELAPFHKIKSEIDQLIVVMPGNLKFIKLCLDKGKLMEVLSKFKISNPLPYRSKKEMSYPAIAKPNNGRGSREVHVIHNSKELNGYLDLYNRKFSQVLFQRYIAGTEYTVSVIVNNLNKIIGIVPKKIIQKRGITRAAVSENNPMINKICEKIVKELQPGGPFNVQLKVFKNQAYIFEINPRLSTTSVLTDQAFGNEVDLFTKYYNQPEIKNSPTFKKNVYLYRYEENYFESH